MAMTLTLGFGTCTTLLPFLFTPTVRSCNFQDMVLDAFQIIEVILTYRSPTLCAQAFTIHESRTNAALQ